MSEMRFYWYSPGDDMLLHAGPRQACDYTLCYGDDLDRMKFSKPFYLATVVCDA